MADLKIKPQFAKTYIAFGKEPVKLGDKSQKELRDLAIMAHESNNDVLIELFEGDLPDVEELKKARSEEEKKKLPQKPGQRNPATSVTQPPRTETSPVKENQQTGNQP